MSATLYNRMYLIVLLPMVVSNFFTVIIMRRRLQRKFGYKMLKGMDKIVVAYVIMFGLFSALIPE